MNKYAIIGYSGHAYVVIEAAKKAGITISAYSDIEEVNNNRYDLNYLGNESDEDFSGWGKGFGFIAGIGDNNIRKKVTELVLDQNEKLVSVVHPNAWVSDSARIGSGTFVSSGAQINAKAEIGKSVIVNTSAVVEHECSIGDFVHIAPGAVLSGNVSVGKGAFIGANSVIKQGITIGENVLIGAGSVILEDVESDTKVVGNPGRVL
jgi:sugar O-acyltransferase (sialic acid O-acetyltransferase NeuD family)